ncbi:MAG TPA: ABC transporter ATP-binding protein, partial [Dehalococcoidia bacterium]|nr:ABC transporter ATP-binding protein [Dehalococcoidia bacterium]
EFSTNSRMVECLSQRLVPHDTEKREVMANRTGTEVVEWYIASGTVLLAQLRFFMGAKSVDGHLKPRIVLRDLSKVYREGDRSRSVLSQVNGTIFGGEFVALVGPSGSGKSTLLNLISGIDAPSSGEVVIDDTNLTGLSEKGRTLFRRKNIGMVFQFFNLLPTLTVQENLFLPLDLNGKSGRGGRAAALDLLEAVGLSERARSFPDRLSGGEQQRVAIARALVHGPQILLADEPTGNLDADTGRQVMGLLVDLARRQGTTLIVATHSPDVIARAGRVFRVRDGQLEQQSQWVATHRPRTDRPRTDRDRTDRDRTDGAGE